MAALEADARCESAPEPVIDHIEFLVLRLRASTGDHPERP
jgi:hypothetical protein